VPNDATFIASPSNPTSANFYEVTLSNPVPPGVATPVVVRYRYAKSSTDGGRTIDLTVELRQGTSVIASATHPNIPGASGSGWQQASLTLTAAQAAAITNGADLRLRIRAITSGGGQGRKAQLSWAETELPPAADPVTSVTYGYDRLSRLTSAADGSGSRSYAYDPVGNRTTRTAGSSTSYTYDRADRLLSAGASPVTVSAVGVTTARGADTFAYDQANRLTQATVAGVTETSTYDGDGVRASRQVGAGPLTRYVTDPGAGLPVTIDDGTQKYVWGLGLAYAVAGSAIEVYHTDRLGSVRALTDAAGTVIATYRSDEFGIPVSSTGTSSQPFRYTGEPLDASGLTYLRARYYDPSVGRFMSRDMVAGFVANPLSLNRYSYVGNNPATLTDPSGGIPCVGAGIAGGAAGSVVPVAGSAGGAIAGFVLCLAAGVVAVGAGAAIGEAMSDPGPQPPVAEARKRNWDNPIYDPRPDPDFNRWNRELSEVAHGPINPHTGSPGSRGFCKSFRCRAAVAAGIATFVSVVVLGQAQATGGRQAKSGVLRQHR